MSAMCKFVHLENLHSEHGSPPYKGGSNSTHKFICLDRLHRFSSAESLSEHARAKHWDRSHSPGSQCQMKSCKGFTIRKEIVGACTLFQLEKKRKNKQTNNQSARHSFFSHSCLLMFLLRVYLQCMPSFPRPHGWDLKPFHQQQLEQQIGGAATVWTVVHE